MTTATITEPSTATKKFISSSHKLLIDGKRVDAMSGENFEVLDPSNNNVLCRVPKGSRQDIDLAVQSARKAFDTGP